MADNLYDKNGNYVGRVISDQEKVDEDFGNFIDTLGCLGIIVAGFLLLFIIAPWFVAVASLFWGSEELGYLFFAIPALIATVIAGNKIKEWRIKTILGTFLCTALIGTGAGIVGGYLSWIVLPDFVYGYSTVGEVIIFVAPVALWYAIGPAAIVAWRTYRSTRKKR